MHDLEPYYQWQHFYDASEDQRSPFYKTIHSEFEFTNKIYNYLIHPQWNDFGANNLYVKVLFVDYDTKHAILEFIGEWDDCIDNDILNIIKGLVNPMLAEGISKFVFVLENVLNFHGSDDLYYEELYENIKDEDGWIVFLGLLPHVEAEMRKSRIHQYVDFGEEWNDLPWRRYNPDLLLEKIESMQQLTLD